MTFLQFAQNQVSTRKPLPIDPRRQVEMIARLKSVLNSVSYTDAEVEVTFIWALSARLYFVACGI
uniref:Uncharacterized protein n=1 Tax=Kalanchoe fedtschenkoi TaxID=63787 RepID=A0A7N0VHJ4_KALFE